jgi:HK97 family phage major capsid protein
VAVPRELDTMESAAFFRGPAGNKIVVDGGFSTVSLPTATIAGAIAFSNELARSVAGNAATLLREVLSRGLARGLDRAFVSADAASEDNPPGVLNGISATPSSGDAVTDLATLIANFVTAGGSLENAVLILSSNNAAAVALSDAAFQSLTIRGGNVAGIPAVAGAAAGSNLILLDRSKVILADDRQFRADTAQHATIEMSAGSPATRLNLWQKNLVAVKTERYVNWSLGENAVAAISGADYLSAGSPA